MYRKVCHFLNLLLFFALIQPTYSVEYTFYSDQVFKALEKAYPDIVTIVPDNEKKHPDPAIIVRNTVFYWVNGRLLPEYERANWSNYGVNAFYSYARHIPDPYTYSKREIEDIRKQSSKVYRKNKKSAHHLFYEKLYGMSSLNDTNTQIVKTTFLKKQVLVHVFAYKPLKKVEAELYKFSVQDKEVRDFLRQIDTVYSFFWRRIAGSKARSLHSYGVAIDTLDSRTKKYYYWLWRYNLKVDWILEPISVRWNPPNSVVNIFEKYGFAWGGKWIFYDTMHFEYRPDLLLLNGYDLTLVQ
ncbi:MAG: M15 family metallopeptidase [Brevinema sp.]